MSNARSPGPRRGLANFEDLDDSVEKSAAPIEAPQAPAPGDAFDNRFRLVKLLGTGAHSEVWEVQDPVSGDALALKLLPSHGQHAARARIEGEIGQVLSGPHFARVHESGLADGYLYILMERLVGEDLGSRLDRENKLGHAALARLALELGGGLGTAHEHGLVHRDLKPTNIFLERTDAGEVTKILDFGVAKQTALARVTTSNMQLGTPHYSAPEQIEDPRRVDARADIWSMAAVLYRCLLGVRPFNGTGAALISAVLRARPSLPTSVDSTVSSDIDLVLLRGLARNKRDRFSSAAALGDAFIAALKSCRPSLR